MDEIVEFRNARSWGTWLAKNHVRSPGVWLRLAKKASGLASVTYAEALEIALCYGWIDGQKKPGSETAWLQRFVPRAERSIWSRINREKAKVLIEAGRMKPAGLAAIERAKANGRWESAYESWSGATVPADLQAELDRNPRAAKFFATLDSGNRYAVLFRIQTARKPETRQRRIARFIAMLAKGEKLHP